MATQWASLDGFNEFINKIYKFVLWDAISNSFETKWKQLFRSINGLAIYFHNFIHTCDDAAAVAATVIVIVFDQSKEKKNPKKFIETFPVNDIFRLNFKIFCFSVVIQLKLQLWRRIRQTHMSSYEFEIIARWHEINKNSFFFVWCALTVPSLAEITETVRARVAVRHECFVSLKCLKFVMMTAMMRPTSKLYIYNMHCTFSAFAKFHD